MRKERGRPRRPKNPKRSENREGRRGFIVQILTLLVMTGSWLFPQQQSVNRPPQSEHAAQKLQARSIAPSAGSRTIRVHLATETSVHVAIATKTHVNAAREAVP